VGWAEKIGRKQGDEGRQDFGVEIKTVVAEWSQNAAAFKRKGACPVCRRRVKAEHVRISMVECDCGHRVTIQQWLAVS